MTKIQARPNLIQALLPILFLIGLLSLNVVIFGDNATSGPNQIALLLAATVGIGVAVFRKQKWDDLLGGIGKSIHTTVPAMIILLLIGALAGTWMISGVVPSMIYYGLKILSPSIFLFAACLISAIVSLATGSSWSTVATVGVALMGIGETLGFSSGLIAGAIISGAYFGDKMSPLSDTTNLAPAMAGTDLFTHIRHMAWTTIPSISIALIVFLIIGFFGTGEANTEKIDGILNALDSSMFISPWLFLVPLVLVLLILKKMPAIPALFIGTIMGGIFAVALQPDLVRSLTSDTPDVLNLVAENSSVKSLTVYANEDGSFTFPNTLQLEDKGGDEFHLANYQVKGIESLMFSKDRNENFILLTDGAYITSSYKAVIKAMFGDTAIKSANDTVNELLTSSGMFGMLNTIWLILCAMIFGGVLEVAGLLQRLTSAILIFAKSTGSLIASTVGTCIVFNATASDQYLAIVVPGRMFAKTYRDRGIKAENLSRTLEDSGTVTSALVPWNTCGAYHSGVLGVATGEYFMYAFFNLISPVMTLIYGYLGFKVPMMTEEEKIEAQKKFEEPVLEV